MRNLGLLLLRLSIGTMLIHHGYEKTADIENFADAFVRPIGIPFPILASYIAAYSEIYGSWLLIGGLFTRIAALSIVGTIGVAIYHAIITSGFNIYLLELLVLYMGGALCILLLGGGDYTVDRLLRKFGIKYNKPHIPFT
tara:strand:- start:205 stop:624 length:420 start_codon:yes stop_codon:yes gene_type:complete